MAYRLVDMHIHLDSFKEPTAVAHELAARGIAALDVSLTPSGYTRACKLLGDAPNIRIAAGLHPWEFGKDGFDPSWIEQACKLAASSPFVGELGIDFLEKHLAKQCWKIQVEAFERICCACAATQADAPIPPLLSIHAVKSATKVLDILESSGAARNCTCIIHWFSGSTEELWRAIHMGCFFSINSMGAATKRAKEQLKLIPDEVLLLESDYPPHGRETTTPAQWAQELEDQLFSAAEKIAQIRGCTTEEVRVCTTENALNLLSL